MLQRILNLIRYYKVFSTMADIQRYRSVAHRGGSNLTETSVRAAGGNCLQIRPHTTDARVLWDTFYFQWHLPPEHLAPEATILDLGANVGYTTLHFAHLYPNARIIAVELDRQNYEAARTNLRAIHRCELIHAAVWSEDGVVSYDRDEEEWGFHVSNEREQLANATMVPARTISTILAERAVDSVDYVKMDIEGAEWPVLSSGEQWLSKVKMIKVELHPQFNEGATYENCARILTSCGFTCHQDQRQTNALIARRVH